MIDIPKQVKVTLCIAVGKRFRFANLTPYSIHNVITPLNGYNNDATGVWVMGIGTPVKLLSNEYVEIS